MALFCEKMLQERDGVFSLIRVVDTITQGATGPEPPKEMPPFITQGINLVIGLRAGDAKGRFGVKVRPEAPSGQQLAAFEQTVHLKPGPEGVSIVAPLVFPVNEEGVYWFDVFLTGPDQPDRPLTRIPLEVFYQPQPTAAS
jgi:hypothetical protein